MILKIAFVFSFLYLLPFSTGSTNDFPTKIDFFEVDVIGNLYFVKNSEIKKYNNQGKELVTYSDLTYGKISTIDVSDAMNILVYYRNYNKVIMLDNMLSVKNSPIDLMELGFAEATHACLSYNNGFWIYDPIGQELLRFNNLLENTDRTGNLSSITNTELHPEQIIERDNQLILRDKDNGIFVFDRFGGFLKQLPFTNLQDFYVRKDSWQMLRNDTNFMFSPTTLNMDTIAMPYHDVVQLRINDNGYYIRYSNNTFFRKQL